MKTPLGWSLLAAVPLAAVLAAVGATAAVAHEGRAAGGIQIVVGWGEEPAYTGFKNSVQVSISETEGGPPVTDLGDSLEVEVSKGSDTIRLPLVTNFGGAVGSPGDYRAWLTPTRPGTYTVRITGSVRGKSVDESFTSSETTFDDVADVASIQFPAKDPSTGQLATRVDREVLRMEAAVRRADERAESARKLAMVGVLVGALGLLTAVGALVSIPRRARRHGGPDGRGSKAGAKQADPGSMNNEAPRP